MLATLSLNQARFAELLEQTPWLEGYWNFDADRPECDIERLKNDMGAWSHGEQIMAQFMHAVWCGENRMDFNLIEAASVLDMKYRTIITDWVKEPFWP